MSRICFFNWVSRFQPINEIWLKLSVNKWHITYFWSHKYWILFDRLCWRTAQLAKKQFNSPWLSLIIRVYDIELQNASDKLRLVWASQSNFMMCHPLINKQVLDTLYLWIVLFSPLVIGLFWWRPSQHDSANHLSDCQVLHASFAKILSIFQQ